MRGGHFGGVPSGEVGEERLDARADIGWLGLHEGVRAFNVIGNKQFHHVGACLAYSFREGADHRREAIPQGCDACVLYATYLYPAPHRHHRIPVLTQHECADLRPTHTELRRDLLTESQRVGECTGSQNPVRPNTFGEYLDPEFDRIGLHDDQRWVDWVQGIGIAAEDLKIVAAEFGAIDHRVHIRGQGDAGEHDDDIGVDLIRIEYHFDAGRVIDERVLEIGSQSEQFMLTLAATMTDKL